MQRSSLGAAGACSARPACSPAPVQRPRKLASFHSIRPTQSWAPGRPGFRRSDFTRRTLPREVGLIPRPRPSLTFSIPACLGAAQTILWAENVSEGLGPEGPSTSPVLWLRRTVPHRLSSSASSHLLSPACLPSKLATDVQCAHTPPGKPQGQQEIHI